MITLSVTQIGASEREEGMMIKIGSAVDMLRCQEALLTLHAKLQVIADRLTLTIDSAAGIIAARVACHLLEDQALV